jgi:hypothetical protein
MKLYLDIKARRFVKSAASNVALQSLVLKRRDSVPLEVVFVANGVAVAAPAGTETTVALKSSFAAANFLALASPGQTILDLNTVPLEAAFAASPAVVSALLEVKWTATGEALRTATLSVEIQNSVIVGTEGTPAVIPDGKATQAQAEAGTDNITWMTPLRTAQAILRLAATSWESITGKPTTFAPSAHTHLKSEITGLNTDLAALTASDTALGQRIDYIAANLDPAALDSIAEAAASIGTIQTALNGKATAAQGALADTALQPVPVNFRGDYNNGLDYTYADVVTYTDGLLYQRVSNPNNPGYPPGHFSWALFSASTGSPAYDLWVSAELANKAATGHTHTISEISDFAEPVVVYPSLADFPTPGRLQRLYLADDLGTLWRWTGTTYQQAPGTIDAGEY